MNELLKADKLVVSQRAKLIELRNQYAIRGADGETLGYIEQEAQSRAKKFFRLVTDLDQFLTHRLAIYERDYRKVLEVTRPRKIFKSRFLVQDGDGRRVGQIVQANVFGKIRFGLVDAQGQPLGQIKAENWRAWDFSIVDRTGREVARIDKKFVGVLRAVFTTGDNYVVDLAPELDGDLRLMVVAAALAVDTALKQDARGLDFTDVIDIADAVG
jgi:uncharacterized protein YxjI